DLLTKDYEGRGLSPTDARRAALVATGGSTQVKEATRDAWLGSSIAALARELRYAWRSLARSPGFVAIAIVTLGVGIAGSTTIFTVVNAALLRPPPDIAAPAELATMERVQPTSTFDDFSYPDAKDFDAQTTTFAGIAAYNGTYMSLSTGRTTERAWVSYVSDNYFDVLGVRPALGRLMMRPDAIDGPDGPVIVLGYSLWERRFGADSIVIGRIVSLIEGRFTVIGVASRRFIGAMTLHPMEAFIPLTATRYASPGGLPADFLTSRSAGWLRLIGRMRPGVTLERAQSDLSTVAARLASTYASNKGRGVRVFAGAGMTFEERVDAARMPRLLSLAVALLLLLACANVASLSLLRASAKRREFATRLALGASRASLTRLLVIEGALIASAAALLGLGLSQLLVRTTSIVGGIVSIHAVDLSIDRRVLLVTIAVAAATAILVSLLPSVHASRTDLAVLLKDGAGGAIRRRTRGQRALVVLQVAASLVLLSSASIVYSAFQRLMHVDPGFDARGLTFDYPELRDIGYDSAARRQFERALYARGQSDPSFDAVALTSTVPPQEYATRVSVFHPGQEPPPGALDGHEFELGTRVAVDAISPNLLDVMRIPLLAGRAFTLADDERSESVVLVSRALADAFWPRANPIGQYLSWPSVSGARRPPMRVVGVVANTRHRSLTSDPPLVMYVPFTQHAELFPAIVVRGKHGVPPSPRAVHDFLMRVDPRVPVFGAQPLIDHVASEIRPQRIASAWIGAFGGIALVLAAIGLYGVVAQGVVQRTRELAVRCALGATPGEVMTQVLRDGLALSALGAVAGVAGSFWAWRALRGMFAGVDANPSAVLAALVLLGTATVAASYVPARRAARLNPVDALRSD